MNETSPRLRIGVDGYNMAMSRGTGVATYARTLCHAIRAAGHELDLVYGLAVPPKTGDAMRETLFFARLGEGVGDGGAAPKPSLRRTVRRALTSPATRDLVAVPVTGRVIADDFAGRLPPFDRLFTLGSMFEVCARYFRRFGRFMPVRVANPPDVMHWTYPLPIRMVGARNIYTIHDLVPLRLPHTSLEDKSYYNRLIARCVADADRIVTVSETSRADILSLFPTDPKRVVNSYQPADVPAERSDSATLDVRLARLFDLKRDGYFLFFGAIEPKKNVGRLIEAYLGADLDTPLVIVGGRGWRWEQELRLLGGGAHGRRLSSAAAVRELEYLPRPLLVELIQGARGVLFPSLYEGFGLPALEALAVGVPVITSNTSSLPEVVGDAAITIDPYDVSAITAALRRLDGDPALRARMRQAGPEQAKKFSMARYQATMDRLYRDTVDGVVGSAGRQRT
jgi:glycosyltransferase involved in cell wall biosynthesis